MEISNNEDYDFVLKKVFSPVILETEGSKKHKIEKETFSICMRDGGFEFNYNGVWYEAKENNINKIGNSEDKMLKTCDNFVKKVLDGNRK